MSNIHQFLKPGVLWMRRALGIASVQASLNELQSRLARIEGLTNSQPAPAPTQAVAEEYASFELDDAQTYELSLPHAPDDSFVQALISGGTRDQTWRFVMDWLRPSDVFFDLGANLGSFTIPAALR